MKKKNWLRDKLLGKSSDLQENTYDFFKELINKEPLSFKQGTIGSGNFYQIEVNVYYEDKSNTDIRVMLSIDDGGWRSIFPMTDSFIKKSC